MLAESRDSAKFTLGVWFSAACLAGREGPRPLCHPASPAHGEQQLEAKSGTFPWIDPNDFCSLSGRDVLGHVDDGIHGNLWIGLYQAGGEDSGQ